MARYQVFSSMPISGYTSTSRSSLSTASSAVVARRSNSALRAWFPPLGPSPLSPTSDTLLVSLLPPLLPLSSWLLWWLPPRRLWRRSKLWKEGRSTTASALSAMAALTSSSTRAEVGEEWQRHRFPPIDDGVVVGGDGAAAGSRVSELSPHPTRMTVTWKRERGSSAMSPRMSSPTEWRCQNRLANPIRMTAVRGGVPRASGGGSEGNGGGGGRR